MKIFIDITPELDAFVRSQVLTGKFPGVNAVVTHALKQLQAEVDGMSVRHGDTQFDGFDQPFGPRAGSTETAANTVRGGLDDISVPVQGSTVWR